MTNKKDVSKVMKDIRKKRKDYSTAGFNNPAVRKKAELTRKPRRKHLVDAEEFTKGENL